MHSPGGALGWERNRLLGAVSADTRAQFTAGLQQVHLNAKQVLAGAGVPIWNVYFPRDAVVSLLVPREDGALIEGATIGNEGLVGLGVFLGDRVGTEKFVVQVEGQAARVPAHDFRSAMSNGGELVRLLSGYAVVLMSQLARTAACNQVHSIGQRVARWLLMSHDRVGRDSFPLGHDGLATLLGIHSASVIEALGALHAARTIEFRRDEITILDVEDLEATACEDYRLMSNAYESIHS